MQFLLFSTIFSVYLLGVKLHIHSVKGGCLINCFPYSVNCFNTEIDQQARKYCGKEEKLLPRCNFSSFPQYREQFLLFSTIFSVYLLGVKLYIHSVKGGCLINCFPCSINCFPQFCKSDMSKYGYLEVFHTVPWISR